MKIHHITTKTQIPPVRSQPDTNKQRGTCEAAGAMKLDTGLGRRIGLGEYVAAFKELLRWGDGGGRSLDVGDLGEVMLSSLGPRSRLGRLSVKRWRAGDPSLEESLVSYSNGRALGGLERGGVTGGEAGASASAWDAAGRSAAPGFGAALVLLPPLVPAAALVARGVEDPLREAVVVAVLLPTGADLLVLNAVLVVVSVLVVVLRGLLGDEAGGVALTIAAAVLLAAVAGAALVVGAGLGGAGPEALNAVLLPVSVVVVLLASPGVVLTAGFLTPAAVPLPISAFAAAALEVWAWLLPLSDGLLGLSDGLLGLVEASLAINETWPRTKRNGNCKSLHCRVEGGIAYQDRHRKYRMLRCTPSPGSSRRLTFMMNRTHALLLDVHR